MSSVITPYNKEQSKKEQVADMFDNIAGNYDFLNHFLSGGIDIYWRKRAIKLLSKHLKAESVIDVQLLDVATGTGDLAIEALSLRPKKVFGVDISDKMLDVGRVKIKKQKIDHIIELKQADSENLPFEDNKFDGITVSFGVRNFENLKKGMSEIYRVLEQGRVAVIVELSKPTNPVFLALYDFYFNHMLPVIGKMVSKDSRAYTYLPESVEAFPHGKAFLEILKELGFRDTKCIPLTFGICSIYIGKK